MKNTRYFAWSVMALSALASCSEKYDFEATDKGPEMKVVALTESVVMGCPLKFEVAMNDQEPLSTLSAGLYFDEEKVADVQLRVKENGTHAGALTVPYYADLADGTATLRLEGRNTRLGLTTMDVDVAVKRPNPDYLTFVAGEKEYKAARTEEAYVYAFTAELPQQIAGYFKTPALDADGTVVTFGWDAANKKLAAGVTDAIPYTYFNAGEWTITANIKTFATAPFLVPVKIGETYMEAITDGYALVLNMTSGSSYSISGLEGISEYESDEDFFKQSGGDITLTAATGQYRVVVDSKNKFIGAETYKDNAPASLAADGTGAIWIIGEGIGKPTLDNQVGWNTDKALCMVPAGDKKFQITVVAGKNIKADNINFKFFLQKGWGGEFGSEKLTTDSDIVGVGTGAEVDGVKHDNGNLYIRKDKALEKDKKYLLTIDVSAGNDNAVLTIKEKTDDPDPNIVVVEKVDDNTMAATLNLVQGKTIRLSGFDMTGWWIDDNYLNVNPDGSMTVKVVDGKYRITVLMDKKFITVKPVNSDGSDVTLNEDGTGGLWLMAWGAGVPSLDYQFGWDSGKAYCMAQVSPSVYKLTGKAGPEKGSVVGQYFRFDYLSIKFFHQNGWGGEMKDPTLAPGTEELLAAPGNLELATGVKLEENATYEFTVDLTAGKEKAVVSFKKL